MQDSSPLVIVHIDCESLGFCVCVLYKGSGVTALAHLDGCGTEAGISEVILKVKQLHSQLGSPEGRYYRDKA